MNTSSSSVGRLIMAVLIVVPKYVIQIELCKYPLTNTLAPSDPIFVVSCTQKREISKMHVKRFMEQNFLRLSLRYNFHTVYTRIFDKRTFFLIALAHSVSSRSCLCVNEHKNVCEHEITPVDSRPACSFALDFVYLCR